MVTTRYQRIDGRRSSPSYCSTVTLVVFVALCLVGVWMMTSSAIVPVQNVEIPPEETQTDVNAQVAVESIPQGVEGGLGDASQDVKGGDAATDTVIHQDETNFEVNQNQNLNEKANENTGEEIKEENIRKEGEDTKNGSDDTPIVETRNDGDGRNDNGESNTEGGGVNSEGKEANTEGGEVNSEGKVTNTEAGERSSEGKERSIEGGEVNSEGKGTNTEGKEVSSEGKETNTEGVEVNSEGTKTGTEVGEVNSEGKGTNTEDRGVSSEGKDTNTESVEVNSEGTKTSTEIGEVNSEGKETNMGGAETNENGQAESQEEKSEGEKKFGENNDGGLHDGQEKESQGEKKSELEESSGKKVQGQIEEVEQNQGKEEQNYGDSKSGNQSTVEVFPDASQSELLNETNTQNSAFSTQAVQSEKEKEVQESSSSEGQTINEKSAAKGDDYGYRWKLCNVTTGADYIPCLDNEKAIKMLRSTKHYEHRERHCPEEAPTCLVPLPEGYRQPILWPSSRDKIWYFNVPHTQLAAIKGHQNWVKVSGEFLTFPGGGTQFKHGATRYIDFIQETMPDIAWGQRSRVVLDVGCGVASFGGYLFEKDVLTLSFAPKDEHEAQVQFALERGIPAISAVMGTQRLPVPGKVFDIVHCARCRVPWHIEGGMLLLELNRVLRPGGFFVWSATPVYRKSEEDREIWNAMTELTKSMCWDLMQVKRERVNEIGAAVFRKPSSNVCYESRAENKPPLCDENLDPNAAWNVPLQACMHRLPVGAGERGSQWPEQWPVRLEKTPYWLNDSQVGVYGKPAPEDFTVDSEHWKNVVSKVYLNGMGIDWSSVRNIMDMRAVYGGFAAALRDLKVWVMNIVPVNSPDTLPIIYERGLFGMYHDWCESFSTYPRSYDLLHADHLFSKLQKRCNLVAVIAEVDRILRPEGKLIVRDKVETIAVVENMVRSLRWEIRMTFTKNDEGLLCVQKTRWRPQEVETDR
ncbi:probable methyltransferase PMT24 [Magnolia sinica]|uniref:probable methyltransferase PMT24 n=1 Tax=Magnolia sinica TaxID=86752 RepID=UPI002657EB99|nr:probable methyltransferase PMT24 [Magnolia sinica]